MNLELRNEFAELLRKTSQSHHDVFAATDGEDPDWPIWYADCQLDPPGQKLGMTFFKSQLIYCLMNADIEHQTRAPDSELSEYYADRIVECHAPSENPESDRLALYHFYGCPFCSMVKSTINKLAG